MDVHFSSDIKSRKTIKMEKLLTNNEFGTTKIVSVINNSSINWTIKMFSFLVTCCVCDISRGCAVIIKSN